MSHGVWILSTQFPAAPTISVKNQSNDAEDGQHMGIFAQVLHVLSGCVFVHQHFAHNSALYFTTFRTTVGETRPGNTYIHAARDGEIPLNIKSNVVGWMQHQPVPSDPRYTSQSQQAPNILLHSLI